ncbi:MAG: 30S ribosomal protein S17 [Candidatus Omnitrophota bacterium]|jgi:small subunit ribosomal protein S17|nr:30S ribosomal protein S17 [Candidatus Omnitrophota bacterium]
MEARSSRKQKMGIVVSDLMEKTIVVRLDRTAKHPVYSRVISKSTKVMVHDEKKEAKTGDKVRIEETRPLSKNKRWRLLEVLKK